MISRLAVVLLLFPSALLVAQTPPNPSPASQPAAEITRGGPGVTPPKVLVAPSPSFSEAERKETISGNVLVYLQVGPDGLPSNVRVLRGVRPDLDLKAVEAVKRYKFQPAMKNGVPVRVEMNVEVNFEIS